jgi:hypothetical protein
VQIFVGGWGYFVELKLLLSQVASSILTIYYGATNLIQGAAKKDFVNALHKLNELVNDEPIWRVFSGHIYSTRSTIGLYEICIPIPVKPLETVKSNQRRRAIRKRDWVQKSQPLSTMRF